MSDAANRVVDSLDTDIQEEKTFNENKTPGVTPARFYDKVSFSKEADRCYLSAFVMVGIWDLLCDTLYPQVDHQQCLT